MLIIERQALDQLAALLLERAGLKIAPDGYYGLKLALSARMPALGISDAEEYVRRLKQLAGEHELRSLLPLVTVGYTEFYRDAKQFNALESKILPDLLARARTENRKMAIWSAGCATGEEAYSLSMVLSELSCPPEDADIWATDLNPAAVENAKLGRYSARRVGSLPERIRKRYFQPFEEGFEVVKDLREYIRFDGQNLAAPIFTKTPPNSLDLILCRNVIIYFDLPNIRGLMDRFLQALRPGGYLLLGYSESLFQVYDKFEMVEIEGAFVYRKRTGPPPVKQPITTELPKIPIKPSPAQMASKKPVLLKRPDPPPPPPPAPAAAEDPSHQPPLERLAAAGASMDRGDFDGALTAVRKLVEDQPDDLAAMLTLGNILSLLGRELEARTAFDLALTREPLCVEARLYAGMAAMQAGNLDLARAELNKALFLEPTLALGHYMSAQVSERLGDHESARRSYRNAIEQLKSPQRPLAGYYPDMKAALDSIARAARYALASLEESQVG